MLDDHKKHNCDDNDNEYDNDCDNDNDSLSSACARVEDSKDSDQTIQEDNTQTKTSQNVAGFIDRSEYGSQIEEVINYLDIVAHKGYRVTAPICELLSRRLDEGFTVDDLKSVIDKKWTEWKGTPRQNYVRPETLFSDAHFQSYLNQEETIEQDSRSGTTRTAETVEATDDDVARIQAAMLKQQRKAAGA